MNLYDIVEIRSEGVETPPGFLQTKRERLREPTRQAQRVTVDLSGYDLGEDPQLGLYQRVSTLAQRLVPEGERRVFEISHPGLGEGVRDDVFDTLGTRAAAARRFFNAEGYQVGSVSDYLGHLTISLGK